VNSAGTTGDLPATSFLIAPYASLADEAWHTPIADRQISDDLSWF
jgi:hypothetical protein